MKIKFYLGLIGYYLLVVLPHEQVGKFLASIFLPGSRVRYDGIMLGVLCLMLSAAGLWMWQKVADRDKIFIGMYTLMTIFFIAMCVNLLFVLNVEAIHFIQYAVFAIICFQINKTYWKTMWWSMIAGGIDELYQYMYLAPTTSDYYDFNDVIINAVGAGLGLILIRAMNPPAHHFNAKTFLTSAEAMFGLSLLLLVGLGLISGYLSYGLDPNALFCFMKVENPAFWYTTTTGPAIEFHIIKPLEGLLLIICLITCYGFLEKGTTSIVDTAKTIE